MKIAVDPEDKMTLSSCEFAVGEINRKAFFGIEVHEDQRYKN
jgi:hypothetical protein